MAEISDKHAEGGVSNIDHEQMNVEASSGNSVSDGSNNSVLNIFSTPEKSQAATSINDRLLLPFEQGWGREIVLRHPTEDMKNKKVPCDVYYFAPEGTKLRSIPEVDRYLNTHPCSLSTDCFSFRREPIYKEPYEIIRMAGKIKSKASLSPASVSPSSIISTKLQSDSPSISSGELLADKRKSLDSSKRRRIELSPPPQKKSYRRTSHLDTVEAAQLPQVDSPATVLDAIVKLEPPNSPIAQPNSQKYEPHAENLSFLQQDNSAIKPQQSKVTGKQKPTLKSLLGRKSSLKTNRGRPKKSLFVVDNEPTNSLLVNSVSDSEHVSKSLKKGRPRLQVATTALFGEKKTVSGDSVKKKVKKIKTTVIKELPAKPCSLTCPGREGKPPTVQCTLCRCLFHSECIGYIESKDINNTFVCGACLAKKSQSKSSVTLTKVDGDNLPPPPPLHTTKSVANNGTRLSKPPPLTPGPHVAAQHNQPIVHSTTSPPRIVGSAPSVHPPPLVAGSMSSVVPPGLQPWLADGASLTPLNQNGSTPRSQISPPSDGAHTSQSAANKSVSGQMLTLPPTVLRVLDLNKQVRLNVNGSTVIVSPDSFKCVDNGVRIFLPAGTLPHSLVAPGAGKPLNIHVDKTNPDCQVLNLREMDAAHGLKVANSAIASRKNLVNVKFAPVCHFLKIQLGFDCMLEIFKYLSLADVLRASRVCRAWRKAASHQSLWQKVKLQGLNVIDWSTASDVLRKNNTVTLDLRGVVVNPQTWDKISDSWNQLSTVLHLELGSCPANVILDICMQMAQLRSLVAKSVVDVEPATSISVAKMDFSKLTALKRLQRLKLRGTNGLSVDVSNNLFSLASLGNLTVLSLTSLRGVTADQFKFLGSLSNLVALEIGDVHLWTSETYALLSSLSKLKMLRLEGSETTAEDDKNLSTSITNLQSLNHLELVHYALSSQLADCLSHLATLQRLCVWPDPGNQASVMNGRVFRAVSKMMNLQELEWGIKSLAESGSLDLTGTKCGTADEIELLPEERKDEDVKLVSELVNLKTLQERLKNQLPDTKVLVFRVPNHLRNNVL